MSLVFLVIGIGVGGVLIFNQQIWYGVYLFGGEFGYIKINIIGMLSELGMVLNVIYWYQ